MSRDDAINGSVVTLTWGDMMLCANVGIMRRTSGIFKKRTGRYGAATHGRHWWGIDIESCVAEYAVSRFCNLTWDGMIGRTDIIDVGGLVQVRSTEKSSNRLMLQDPDEDEQPFVLAIVQSNVIMLAGWVFAKEGKKKEYWETHKDQQTGRDRSAYFVPHNGMRPMDELLLWLDKTKPRSA